MPSTSRSPSTTAETTRTPGVRRVQPPSVDLSGLGAATGGAWTVADAVAAGLTREQVRRRLERGEWQRVQRGVLTDAGVVPDPLLRAWAAVVAAGGPGRARAAGRTTARLLGLPLVDDMDPSTGAHDAVNDDVAVTARSGVRQRRTLHVVRLELAAGDRVRLGGCPSLSLPRALPGLAGVLSFEALVCLLDAALHRGLLSPGDLDAVLVRHAGRRHARVLRRAVAASDGRAESPAETLARLVLLPVLPALVPQVRLLDAAARPVARFDLADEALRLAVEVDGRRGHAGAVMAARDHRRDRTAASYGWTTERCTWWELRRGQEALRRRILATARRLAARPAA